MNILIYARSYLIENFLINLHQQGKKMQIFIIDNPPFHEGEKSLKRLKLLGLQVNYILLSHVAYIIHKMDKVFVGA
jgi:translation initiation factor eIF-2B subunit delta